MEQSGFAITTRDSAGVTVISVRGELDVATADQLRDALSDAPAIRGVVVDLTEVGFLDSTALGVLIAGVQQASTRGWGFGIAGATRAVQKVIEVTGLNDLIPTYDSIEEAIASISGIEG